MPHGQIVHDGFVVYRQPTLAGVGGAPTRHREPIPGAKGPAFRPKAGDANFWALKVEERRQGRRRWAARAEPGEALGMVFVSAVGEIKPSNVHTRSQQALERLVVVTSRAEVQMIRVRR